MTEQMLREALRDAMAVSPAPPPMSSATMVRIARRARTRRRVGWSGASCAAMAATLAVGTSVLPGVPPATSNTLDAGGAPQAAPAFAPAVPQAEPAGPQDPGTVLLNQLLTVVPAGYTPSTPLHQAQVSDRVNGVDVWALQAQVALSRAGGTGQLVVEVYTAGNTINGASCELVQKVWTGNVGCEVLTVASGAQVGVVTGPSGEDQWAGYRCPDGTVVLLAQGRQADNGNTPLPDLPFGTPQFAALATDRRFDLPLPAGG